MLRRKPTAIAVTSEDLAAFEDARLRKLAEENNNQSQGENSANTHYDPSDELKPLPGDKARIVRSREERIGIRRRNWGSLCWQVIFLCRILRKFTRDYHSYAQEYVIILWPAVFHLFEWSLSKHSICIRIQREYGCRAWQTDTCRQFASESVRFFSHRRFDQVFLLHLQRSIYLMYTNIDGK